MQDYFKREYYEEAKAQRKKMFIVLFIIIGIYLLISAGLFIWYTTLPYKSPTISTVKAIEYIISGIFVFIIVVFMGIKFKRVNKFYVKCTEILTGLTEQGFGSFIEYDNSLHTKDGVDFKSLIFLEYNKNKQNFFERAVLVFYEKPLPEFSEGQNVKYITQGNVLKSYEIVEDKEGEE